MQVVLITGSSGRLGAATVKQLSKTHRVIGFDSASDPHLPPEAEPVGRCPEMDSYPRHGDSQARQAAPDYSRPRAMESGPLRPDIRVRP